MKQTNIEKLKQIVLDMINNGGTEEDLPAVIAHIDRLSQESDWISDIAFIVEARKFGREAAHSYTVAVCDKLQLAKEIAEWHADHRGGKYGIKVYQYTKNIGTEALEKSNAELCVYEIKSPYADEKLSNKAVELPKQPKTINK